MYKLLNKIRKIFFLYSREDKKEHDLVSKEEVRQKTHDMLKERNKEKKMKKRLRIFKSQHKKFRRKHKFIFFVLIFCFRIIQGVEGRQVGYT